MKSLAEFLDSLAPERRAKVEARANELIREEAKKLHTDLHLVNMRDYIKKPTTWEEICDLITTSARNLSLEHGDELHQLEAEREFYNNIKGYCEQNVEDIEMVMDNPDKYSR